MWTPSNAIEVLLVMLAVWRYSYMGIHEGGFLGVFDLVRAIANKVGIGELFACIYCLSVWVAAIVVLLLNLAPVVGLVVVQIGALSASAIIVQRLMAYQVDRSRHG